MYRPMFLKNHSLQPLASTKLVLSVGNNIQYIYMFISYIIMLVLCASVCVRVGVWVCFSNLRYLEWEVVSPCSLNRLEELHLASCTNCFSSLHDARFMRKSLCKFFASYAPNPMHA